MSKTLVEKLGLGAALLWTLLGALALEGGRAPLGVAGREAGRCGAAAEGSSTDAPADIDEFRWGYERRTRRWREVVALQRRHHVAIRAPEGVDCGYRPGELWTGAAEPQKHRAIVRGRKKHGRIKIVSQRHKGCSAATAVDVDVDVDTVVVN